MFASKLLYLSILLFVSLVSSTCTKGRADTCSNNPNPSYQENDYNYHPTTCNDKWDHCKDPNNPNSQKPQAYYLCTSKGQPSGGVPVDWYTLSIQNLGFAPVAYTLHGLWPGSYFGRNDKDQPFGCQNAEEFNQTYLTTFGDLFTTFWPTDPTRGNTQYCFILSEWMKHGTCAVINGQEDSSTFRLNQDTYYRTAIVLANEYNQNSDLRQVWPESQVNGPSGANFPISVGCVQCAYWATVGWTDTTVDGVPRMSSTCLDQCILCNSHTCYAANLDSTINFDPSNAPALPSVMTRTVPTMASASFVATGDSDTNAKKTEKKAETTAASKKTTPTSKSSDFLEGGVWRSFGAEQIGSGKFEFAQQFSDQSFTSTTDSPYPQKCLYSSQITGQDTENVKLTNCGSNNHTETCIVQHLKEVGNLEVAFFACNHSGSPAPVDFQAAMDTPQCGNFLMFRCKKLPCSFSPVVSNAGYVDSIYENFGIAPTDKSHVGYERSHQGVAGAPPVLLGTWRALEVSQFYQTGLARWNFTSDAQATIEWPNYPTRSIERYAVSHGKGRNFYLTDSGGHIKSCIFDFKYNEVYSYAVFACGPDDGDAPKNFNDAFNQPNTQYAMGRCNPCSPNCRYSCSATNNNCGIGPSCHAHTEEPASKSKSNTNQTTQDTWTPPNWCKPGEVGCWPTKSEIQALEQQLGPNDARTGLKWFGYPQPQTGPVPDSSIDNQTLYGLGFNDTNGLKALYYYENLQDLTKPCFTGKSTPSQLNSVSDMCKAAVRQGEYRDWNPFIVVFPLNERHVTRALEFAAKHRLCISVAGTGHEYLSRNVCPAGGILIRMLLFKEKSFLSSWKEDPQISPDGAFRFGAGATFSEMHHFSATKNRIIASGWCSTVGMVGFHLGGGHGPFAPSMGLGVDNLLEIEVLQIGRDSNGRTKVHKLIASRRSNPQLFWAMRGGGGGVWGVILSMTIRAHALPSGGSVNRVFITQSGTFCPGSGQFGYEWLRDMWTRFAHWNLMINQKVSTQAAFFIDPSKYSSGGLCAVTWTFNFEYFYAGSQSEPNYKLFRDKLKNEVMEASKVTETNYKNVFDYVQSMKADQFLLKPGNPLPDPHSPSDNATGSQNSVLVSRQAMEAHFAATMMDVLDICVSSLQNKDPTSPDPSGYRCGFHYLYTSVTGNLGSEQPSGTAISPGFRHALMLWNARTLSTDQIRDTLYRIGTNSYFSESSFVMHDWVDHYWGKPIYDQLLAVKKAHDPDNRFWCRHCVGDNPNDAYGNPLGASQ